MLRNANRALDEVAPLLSPKRILVVDDNELYLEAIATALRSDGYDVVLARSGEAALQVLAAQAMDCVLLDRAMPGLGGMETCRQLKASSALRELPVIMLSASADRQAMIDALAAGADDHIVKSEEIGVLKARIHARIRRKQLEDDHRRRREELLRSELHAAAAQAARHEAEAKSALARELERQNQELEAFAYSVSHDLRSPLRSIDAFSLALIEDHAENLGDIGRGYLAQIRGSARRMGQLIDDLMALSRISRTQVHRQSVNLSEVAHTVATELVQTAPTRKVAFDVERRLFADADRGLVRLLLENLLNNAWKFTGKRLDARIEFGAAEDGGERVYFVQDNGAGFDQASATRLFQPFSRLHTEEEFSGTGIGLATVRRIVERHGGRVWAEGAAGLGARFFFTLARGSTR
jgi:two-component system NtrC family sensor kinase